MTKVEVLSLLGLVLILGCVWFFTYFAWCECRDMGHSFIYCIMTLG
jgi:hypothetical protein